jgi:hypothetical protein
MASFSASIATRVSWILVISACSTTSNTAQLAGPTACDGITCGSGQLCVEGQAFPDDGGIPAHCTDVTVDCPIFDCDYNTGPACPSCVSTLCASCIPGQDCAIVQGRTVTCV